MPMRSDALRDAESQPPFPHERYESAVGALAPQYQANSPVPHLYFTDFLDEDVAHVLAAEFPDHDDESWIQYKHINENKSGKDKRDELPELIGRVIDELNSPRFVAFLRRLTGIADLIADPAIEGGGMHQAQTGGFLNVHTDFTTHRQQPTWRRRCNLILYLNEGWEEAWGGNLEFWSSDMRRCVASLPPLLNRAVIFNTPGALHGYPDPLRCPEGHARKSVQLYYYTVDAAPDEVPHATTYHARPKDGRLKRVLIRLDNKMLEVYAWLKRRLGISDASVSWILRKLGRKKH